MRKSWVAAGVLALGAVACEPEKQQPPQSAEAGFVVAPFDPGAVPPVVPTPNDLAINPKTGLVEAPVDPSAPAAQQEFTRDYLNTLDGFPVSAVASTAMPDLDPATLSASTVLLIDLKPEANLPAVTPELGYDAQRGLLTVTPPRSGWPKGGHYAVAVIGGANGVKGQGGKALVASPAWYLLRSPQPLVSCREGVEPSPTTCRATTNALPTTSHDPAEALREQAATALRLETLRTRYAPVLALLEARGIHRDDVALLWTFKVVSLPEATFDPRDNVVPFPNDLLRDPATGLVKLPVPSDAPAEQQALLKGLNGLDGFSTTMPIVSENSDTLGAIDVGRLDASLLAAATRFVKVTPTGAVPQLDVKVCLDCASSKKADGSTPSNPSQLQVVPRLPLAEKSTYAVVLTTGLKNEQGQRVVPSAAFALLRSSAPLVDAAGRSQVSGVQDAQAQQLEKGRLAFQPLVDGLGKAGLARKDLLLSWAFTTQSTVSTLKELHAQPARLGAGNAALPAAPTSLMKVTDTVKTRMPASLPKDSIGDIFQGYLAVPFALTRQDGTLSTQRGEDGKLGLQQVRYQHVPFMLVLPATPPTAEQVNGYPVAIFGHGLRGNHQHMLPMANALARAGYAVVAMDTVRHGERSTCVGSASFLKQALNNAAATDDWACADRVTQQCDDEPPSPSFGRCVARPGTPRDNRASCDFATDGDLVCAAAGQGLCLQENRCEGGSFALNSGAVLISGWNMLDLGNFFATRDNFRQQVIDLAQLVRVLQGEGMDEQLAELGAPALDGTRIDYVGQSLGGVLGTLYTSVSPDVHRVVLNVPGGRLTQLLEEATDKNFVAMRTTLYTTLADRQMPRGSPAFDTFIRTAQWILDPADPVNHSWFVSNQADVPSDREALVQFITDDKVIPNSSTRALIDAANGRGDSSKRLFTSEVNPPLSGTTGLGGDDRHGFLTNFANQGITQTAQEEAVRFLTDK
jgi:pimeloyl-ACP methyl ester carboxylesterase